MARFRMTRYDAAGWILRYWWVVVAAGVAFSIWLGAGLEQVPHS